MHAGWFLTALLLDAIGVYLHVRFGVVWGLPFYLGFALSMSRAFWHRGKRRRRSNDAPGPHDK